jgi:hypothetical protein
MLHRARVALIFGRRYIEHSPVRNMESVEAIGKTTVISGERQRRGAAAVVNVTVATLIRIEAPCQ